MRRKAWGIGALIIIWALIGWAQTFGPGDIYYGGIRLQFSGRLVTAGTCSAATQVAPGVTQIRCQVPEGAAGTVELAATRTPAGAVNIRVESPPAGWPTSLWVQQLGQWVDSRTAVASGWGTVMAQYRFTPPAGSAGRQFTLRFKAWTAGVIGELELRLILDIVRAVTPTPPPTEPTVPPSYGPFTGTSDATGRFEVPIPTLPNTSVTGNLTECTVRTLPRTQVSVTLVPKPGRTIRSAGDIGAVRVSSSGYIETEIVQLMFASSIDIFGRTYTTVGTGTVCLRPTVPLPPPPGIPTGPITGKSDAEGKFTATLGPGVTVTGRLTECTVKPLPNQEFTLTLVPKGETLVVDDLGGFTFAVPGYAATTVTQFSKFSLFGLTSYMTGDVCLFTIVCPEIPLRVLTQNAKRITHGDDTLPAREGGIFELLRTPPIPPEHNFDIVCLQEWFQNITLWGKLGLEAWSEQKGPLLRHWLGVGVQPDLTERDVENTTVGGIRIVDARPNNMACEIILGPNYVAGPDAAGPGETRFDGGLVVLVRPGLSIVRASAFVFSSSDGWDGYASKGALYARVQLDPTNPDCYLHVFNTHLQAGTARDDADIRRRQMHELVRFIVNCTQDDRPAEKVEHPIILCGDFNIIGGSQEWKDWLQNFAAAGVRFGDAWLKSGRFEQPVKDAATWAGNDQDTTGTPWGPRNALATEGGDFQRLDYIFFFEGERPLRLQLKSVDREPGAARARPYPWGAHTVSDHLGVVALFTVGLK